MCTFIATVLNQSTQIHNMTYYPKIEHYHANLATKIHLHKDWYIYTIFMSEKKAWLIFFNESVGQKLPA